ncbi:ARPP-2 domain-containing protein [Streptomyces sp. NPDC087851]|uniref:ARPP-2 domain-containing protein n=1 Tax=Streptomyces sp. NPDC087851 TaxID=3365810 RepID=UPI0038004FB1
MTGLDLTGLTARPAQVWGGIRLVPLVREAPVPGLRLHREIYTGLGESAYGGVSEVEVGSGVRYASYIPHGFVADWSGDGGQHAAYGSHLGDERPRTVRLRPHHRMVKRARTARGGGPVARCRFLPLHLALDGYLALHFGGPSTAWDEWSQQAIRRGLSPRVEAAYLGMGVRGLADALRVFEIHPGQCGVMVYAADSLAAAFVVPHPDDYRALHPTLLQDMYGELIHQHALYGAPVPEFEARIPDGRHLNTLADLRAAAHAQERAWSEAHDTVLARALLTTSYSFERVYRMDGFELRRFLPPFRRGYGAEPEQHIGELISDHKGRTAYLKTFRLSDAQIKRGHLLSRLAAHDWHPGRTAEALGTTDVELLRRIRAAGFGSLLKAHAVGGTAAAADGAASSQKATE